MLTDEKLTELFRYSFSLIDSRMTPNQQAFCRLIESAACAERDARIAELTRELEEARKDAERLTNEQIDAGIKAWFSTDITINEGNDRGHPFRQRMRAAIRAAIKEQT